MLTAALLGAGGGVYGADTASSGETTTVTELTSGGPSVPVAMDRAANPTATSGGTVPAGPARSTGGLTTARPAGPPAVARGQVPVSVSVPSVGLRSPIRSVGVDRHGLMQIPEDLRTAGWYRYGARPGQGGGATVLAAHVDTAAAGVGPWASLKKVRVGATVTLGTDKQDIRYQVTEVIRVRKAGLDTASLFSTVGPERLHLVTCGGRFDARTGHYQDNLIVVARRVVAQGSQRR